MVGLGILLIVLGFGSIILEQMGYVFRILEWAQDYQPGIGIGVGVIGVILVGVGIAMNRKNETNVTINNPPAQGQVPPEGTQQWAPPVQGQPVQGQPVQGQPVQGQPVQNDPRYPDNPPRG